MHRPRRCKLADQRREAGRTDRHHAALRRLRQRPLADSEASKLIDICRDGWQDGRLRQHHRLLRTTATSACCRRSPTAPPASASRPATSAGVYDSLTNTAQAARRPDHAPHRGAAVPEYDYQVFVSHSGRQAQRGGRPAAHPRPQARGRRRRLQVPQAHQGGVRQARPRAAGPDQRTRLRLRPRAARRGQPQHGQVRPRQHLRRARSSTRHGRALTNNQVAALATGPRPAPVPARAARRARRHRPRCRSTARSRC